MTRDEILAMPAGRELDALVAEKVMGLEQPERFRYRASRGDGTEHIAETIMCEHYSTDILAAWQVREKILGMSGEFGIIDIKWGSGCGDVCTIYPRQSYKDLVEARGKTAPEVICKAALLATLNL